MKLSTLKLKLSTLKSVSEPFGSNQRTRSLKLNAIALLAVLSVITTAQAQLTVSDDFNDGNDVGWTPYEGSPGTRQVSFPPDPQGGFFYRILDNQSTNSLGLFSRGASIRNDATYTDFFVASDVITWDDTAQMAPFIIARTATPGPGTTSGYITVFASGGPTAVQGLLLPVEFTGEVVATTPDISTGGAALTPKLDGTKGYRLVFKSAPGDLLIQEMYERTDLLEPFARAVLRDDVNGTQHPSGVSGIGNLNLEWTANADSTFDNFYASPNINNFIGFPGTPQVVNLVPAPQTLFYTIPASDQITFTATTFGTNQVATNSLKLLLNGLDVTAGLSFTEVITPLVGSPRTNFTVRWNGSLSSNTIYNGKIIVVNPAGKGTTNNWVFDTFRTNGTLTIEAEDYNYGAGQFQDYPPVSGLQPDATQVAGGGPPNGYYDGFDSVGGVPLTDIVGQEDVDYHEFNTPDRRQRAQDIAARHQYRAADFTDTAQGRMNRTYDVRQKYRDADVGEYIVLGLNASEWMNYTRTFPSNNYYVYLRASSQKAQAVRFDEVTSDRTLSNQTTAVRGEFLVPNTGGSSRFRYVPLTDAAGNIQSLNLAGVRTLRLTDLESSQKNAIDVGDLQLNYLLFVPAPAPGTQRPFIAYASPAGGTVVFDPEGTAQISISNRDTSVTTGSIQLKFDGVNVTGSAVITPVATGATISYKPPGFLLPDSVHTINVVFSDGTPQTNQWSFAVLHMPQLLPSHRESTGPDTNFTVRVHKAQNANPANDIVDTFGNSISRAERQLAGTLGNPDTLEPSFVNEADTNGGFNAVDFSEPTAIHYEQCGGGTRYFGQAKPYPGIPVTDTNNGTYDCSAGSSPDHFAIGATIKLQLAAGIYRMGFDCDDQVAVMAGPRGTNQTVASPDNVELGHSQILGNRTDDDFGRAQFEFCVQTNGVYKFRMVQEEGGGGAAADWFWVNRTNYTLRTLVTPTLPVTVQLFSSAAVNGTYTVDPSAVIDTGAKTATVAKSGSTRFYKLSAGSSLNITNITLSGGNVVLKYQ
ncbi:MAG: hypothetical protein HY298_04140 [Verrucomicrobia bacterium]|nr:hypothetical protein [Verrucomicrobiota bacterium]